MRVAVRNSLSGPQAHFSVGKPQECICATSRSYYIGSIQGKTENGMSKLIPRFPGTRGRQSIYVAFANSW